MTSPGERLRVLFLHPWPGSHASEESLLELLSALPATVAPTVVTAREGLLSEAARRRGIEVHVEPLPPPWRVATFLRAVRSIRRRLDGGVDLVHATHPAAAFLALRARRGRAVPVIWHLREPLRWSPTLALLRRRTDGWIAESKWMIAEMGIAEDDRRGFVLCPGVDEALLIAEPHRTQRHRFENPPRVGMLVPVERVSGVREFVQLGRRLERAGVAVILRVTGWRCHTPRAVAGAEWQQRVAELLRHARRLGMAHEIEVEPLSEDLRPFLDRLDVLVVPGWNEPGSRAVLAGMARGLPVIAARHGVTEDVLRSGDDGWLVPPRDSQALALATRFLIRHPEMARTMGERARRRIVEQYRHVHTASAIAQIYESFVDGRGATAPAQSRDAVTSA